MKKILLLLAVAVICSACGEKKYQKTGKKLSSLNLGLIAYYPFNGNTNDGSGNNNNGIANNVTPTEDRFGNTNAAIYFNGIDSYIRVKDTALLRLNNTDFTLNSWVKLNNYNASFGSIIMTKRGEGSSNGWNFGIAGYADLNNAVHAVGIVTYSISGGDDPFSAGTKKIDTGKWHMITTVYNNSKHEVKIYVDGFLDVVTKNIKSPSATATADLYIGADYVTSAYHLNGKMDDLRIYNRELTAQEVVALFTLPADNVLYK